MSLIYKWIKDEVSYVFIVSALAYSVALTLLFKFSLRHFFGIEYEDAFIYNLSAKLLYNKIYPISFLTDGIILGSINAPNITATYSSHFITFPTLISWVYAITGYNIYIPNFINVFLEFLTILTLSISAKKIFNAGKYWFVFPTIYCLAPIINIFGSSQLSETFSSFLVITTILAYFYYLKNNSLDNLLIFVVSYLLAIITRRENIVILLFVLVVSFLQWIRTKKLKEFLPILITITISLIFFVFVQNVFELNRLESQEIGQDNFSLNYIIKLIPYYINSLMDVNLFNISFFIMIIASIYFLINWRKNQDMVSLILLYATFLFVYSFHYRNYGFIKYGTINQFDTFRYLNNFYEILTLVISVFLIKIININRITRITILSIVIVSLMFSFTRSITLSKEYSSSEFVTELSIPKRILAFIDSQQDCLLASNDIIIYQILDDNKLNICSLGLLPKFYPKMKNYNRILVYLKESSQKSIDTRNPQITAFLKTVDLKEIKKFRNQGVLYEIVKNTRTNL